jgi:hypothetical protein
METKHYMDKVMSYLDKIDPIKGGSIDIRGLRRFHVFPVYEEGMLTGVNVSNLGTSPFLPLAVFESTISLLLEKEDQKAIKGSARGDRLGSEILPLDSVEGHIARTVYGKNLGESCFQRIVPVTYILQEAGVIINGRGWIQLR